METEKRQDSDLSRLPDLTTESILRALNARYNKDIIYTSVRDILIAVNPYKPIRIYDEQTHFDYHWDQFVPDQAPHVFQVAAEAYKRLRDTSTDQVIIVSGESGAGKTESTKHMVRHLVHMCQKDDMDLHERIIKINPLLEAYGNAKTVLNDNSSRFAKYLEISFKDNWQIAGAVVRDYMLEKSRVVHQCDREGNFHIFYALFAGCPDSLKEDLFLDGDTDQFRIMQSDPYSLADTDRYKSMYDESMEIIKSIGVDSEILHIMLAAVIQVTEIEFEEADNGVAQIKDATPFVHACMLLNLDEESFGHALIASKRTLEGQVVATFKTLKEARDGRDALAKILYERMFGWLVRQINVNLHPHRLGTDIAGNVGILDIAGFEKLKDNSFEQMLINLVNEKLQYFMNMKIFKQEMEIYQAEGIDLGGIRFVNNEDILQMFEEKKVGIFDILDEVCNYKQSSDTSFHSQITERYQSHSKFEKGKAELMFGIHHFAAMVPYSAKDFVEKNRDRLNIELLEVMQNSINPFISDLFMVKKGPTGTISTAAQNYRASRRGVKVMTHVKGTELKSTPKGRELAVQLGKSLKTKFGTVKMPKNGATNSTVQPDKTLLNYYRRSLFELLQTLGSGQPFFVRCIKPNDAHKPDIFDANLVEEQLKYNGLAEVAKIRKMGFAVRRNFDEFVQRYRSTHPFEELPNSMKDAAQKIVLNSPKDLHRYFRLGKTKIFMTHALETHMEKLLALRRRSAARSVTNCMRDVAEQKRKERLQRECEEAMKRRLEEKERREREERERVERERNENRNKAFSAKETKLFDDTDSGNSGDPSEAYYTGGSSSSAGSSVPPYTPNHVNMNGPTRVPLKPSLKMTNRPPSPEVQTHEEADERPAKKNKLAFWDLPQIIARERKVRDVHEDRGLQVIKVVTYVVIFLVLLFCAVVQKISLVTLVSYQYPLTANHTESEVQEQQIVAATKHFLLSIAILIPYVLIFLSSMLKWMFGAFLMPGWSTILVSCVTELLHSVGLLILVFIVLPELDIVRGIILINGVAVVPSLLFPVCASEVKISRKQAEEEAEKTGPMKLLAVFCFNVLTTIIQVGFIPLVLVTDNFIPTSHVDKDLTLIALFIVGMLCVSFSWWENFVDDRFCGETTQRSFMKSTVLAMKFDLQEARPVVTFFTSILKISVTILATYLTKTYRPYHDAPNSDVHSIDDITLGQVFSKLGEMELKDNAAIIALTLSAFVGYYVGYTACKLKLQTFSFNIPLLLSTPTAVILATFDCEGNVFGLFTNELQNECNDMYSDWNRIFAYIVGMVVWISIYWLCRHIFYPNIERLAKTERLFMNPYYCSVLLEQHMILNRRRHNRRVHKMIKEDKEYYRLSEFNSKINVEGEEVDDKDSLSQLSQGDSEEDTDIHSDKYRNRKFRDIPTIYACATMWHENKQEMLQLLKSLFRMDRDQSLRRMAEVISGKQDKDYYEFEAHVFFDDCMELSDTDEHVPNSFVRLLISVMEEAVNSVYESRIGIRAPYLVPSPYGGQLIYCMPGDNFLFIHLKDKSKIRHKKRWSQVMYMYYLLGFRIVRMCQATVDAALEDGKINELLGWEDGSKVAINAIGRSHIFQAFDEQVLRKASNTFLLALDGDVDFSPGAVRLLVDRMRKSEKVGAACGRIHPIGTGPVVWFQKFEYAIAHWLQKATEHVLGCVLCSPGCFSLFRGSSLMDDNVMKKYTILPTEASHHLMYDQGEDRWLCTLLLQQGYRVDYAAGSDAFTYAPEGFGEFFNQRRRWMPSTVFNIIDLLADYQNTVYINSNISMLYIFYQASLLVSTIIGPATILMMIAGANLVVFKTNLIWSYVIAMVPAIFYFILCLTAKPKLQIQVAEVLTGIYAFVMMIVLVGTVVAAIKESPYHPSVVFIVFLVFSFSFSALLHPKEWTCVIFGALYFILIPTGFLLLIIYSLANMNVISWGTREVAKKKTKQELEEEKKKEEEKARKKREQGFFGKFFPTFPTKDLKEFLTKITDSSSRGAPMPENTETVKILKEINDNMRKLVEQKTFPKKDEPGKSDITEESKDTNQPVKGILRNTKTEATRERTVSISDPKEDDEDDKPGPEPQKKKRDELVNPAWGETDELKDCKRVSMMPEELKFWNDFIGKYLKPLEIDAETKKQTANSLLELRTNICIGMAIINLLWIAINFMFQFTSPTKITLAGGSTDSSNDDDLEEDLEASEDESDGPISGLSVDFLGLMFVFFYLLILLIQFAGMILHRWGTFLHLVSVTRLRNPFHVRSLRKQRQDNDPSKPDIDPEQAIKICEAVLSEPLPDYADESDHDDSDEEDHRLKQLETLQKTGTRIGISYRDNQFGATTRILDKSKRSADTNPLARSAKIISDGLKAGRTVSVPEREEQLRAVQNQYRKEKDKYIDRPLPPVRRRFNFGPGRAQIASKWKSLIDRQPTREGSDEPLIDESITREDDEIYDVIKNQGTVGRQLGKKLRLYAKSAGNKGVSFNITESGRPMGDNYTFDRHHQSSAYPGRYGHRY